MRAPRRSTPAVVSVARGHEEHHDSQVRRRYGPDCPSVRVGFEAAEHHPPMWTHVCLASSLRSLSQTKLTAEGAERIEEMINLNCTLSECTLLKNAFGVAAAKRLADISKNKKISLVGIAPTQAEANFCRQGLTAADAILIVAALEFRHRIAKVRDALQLTLINGGARCVAIVITSAIHLSAVARLAQINLAGNALGRGGKEGIEAIVDVIVKGCKLKEMTLLGNNLDSTAAKLLAQVAKAHRISVCGVSGKSVIDLRSVGLAPEELFLVAGESSRILSKVFCNPTASKDFTRCRQPRSSHRIVPPEL